MSKLLQAMAFLKMGISIIPLRHRSKEPMLKSWQPYQHILSTSYEVHQWLGSDWNNYGVVAGWNNLAFLDFDDHYAFSLWKSYMELMRFAMPYTVLSARGAHVYISLSARGSNQKRRGVDVKFHGYVVGPGSTHPNGTQYGALGPWHLQPIDSLDEILPMELFPMVAPMACGPMEPMAINNNNTEYLTDPFETAGMDLITKVKRAVRIESFFADVYKTSGDGRWFKTLCPFHQDKNPSGWIDTARQLFGCNACNFKPMDCINLYSRMHNVNESAAVTMMAKEIGVWA